MGKFAGKWLNIYRDESGLFFWSVLLLFLIRSSGIVFNNFAETAFLKRFGVEYLPMVTMANSVTTFVIMAVLTGVMARRSGARLLAAVLLFCGASVGVLRPVVPLGFGLIYPLLFVMKSQYEALLALLFWNLCNDLFNTRQSKRIFPLITAGGVLGGILGSFGTPALARHISLDNLMWVYLGTTWAAALAVTGMGRKFPSLLLSTGSPRKKGARFGVVSEFRKVMPLIHESTLVKILMLLVLLPNVIIPIFNYQFNFAVDETFANERTMIEFFGYFRGALNVVSLTILLFVGRIYGRWGIPVALMFHPLNYAVAFLGLLFRFDIFAAMYGRISTNVIRTTVNNPARAVLMGLFPAAQRAVVRPFLRGTVVRVGTLSGAVLVLLSEGLIHPRFLSLAALVFVGGWVAAAVALKRTYSGILLDLVARNQLDLKSLEKDVIGDMFRDAKVRQRLIRDLEEATGRTCIWYAELLAGLGIREADHAILSVLEKKDEDTQARLLSLISPRAASDAVAVLLGMAEEAGPSVMLAMAMAAARFPPDVAAPLQAALYEKGPNPEVKAYAMAGLYGQDPDRYRPVVEQWLNALDGATRKAGIIAAGLTRDQTFIPKLMALAEKEDNTPLLPFILKALQEQGAPDLDRLAVPNLDSPLVAVRLAALECLSLENDQGLRIAIRMLGDPAEQVRALAKERIQEAPHQNLQLLVESLVLPGRSIRKGIFELLESLDVKDLDVYRFARSQLEQGYRLLAMAQGLRTLPASRERELLRDHLEQQRLVCLENVLRVLAAQDETGQMRTLWRGLNARDARQRANSLEALEALVDSSLTKILVPHLEDMPAARRLAAGRKFFPLSLPDSRGPDLYAALLGSGDWVCALLALQMAAKDGDGGPDREAVRDLLTRSENPFVRGMAEAFLNHGSPGRAREEGGVAAEISIPDRIVHLKEIEIFEGLSVSELAAVASVAEEMDSAPGQEVIREGEPGETMYLIVSGEVSVLKEREEGQRIELDRIGAGDYFGEMALFEDEVRSATIRTEKPARLLVLHKQEFREIVREYPEIALQICRVLGRRIRRLHEKVRRYEK